MITISAFNDRDDALISKALLEAAGVPVTLKEEEGRLFLLVRETDARHAHSVLTGPDREETSGSRWRFEALAESGWWAFVLGAFYAVGGVSTLALLLLPLGLAIRMDLFGLLALAAAGGCAGLLWRSIRIRPSSRFSRRI